MLRTAVIPAAGLGARMLPVTKAVPKELLPVGAKPLIQYCVEEAAASGIETVCIVTSPRNSLVRDYFERPPEPRLSRTPAMRSLGALARRCRIVFAGQPEPRGLGDAILCAADVVGGEPFALMLPDNLVLSPVPALAQLRLTFDRFGADTVGAACLTPARAPLFTMSGRIEWEPAGGRDIRVTRFLPKRRGYCPRTGRPIVRSIARAILLPHFLDIARRLRVASRGELDDGPVFREILARGAVMGRLLEGAVFDAGNPRGYAAANARLGIGGRGR